MVHLLSDRNALPLTNPKKLIGLSNHRADAALILPLARHAPLCGMVQVRAASPAWHCRDHALRYDVVVRPSREWARVPLRGRSPTKQGCSFGRHSRLARPRG